MITWISRTLALGIHDRQLAEHGGGGGVRDERLLESALARPQQLFAYGDPPPDLAHLAASVAYGIARNHPFVDGNKRTAAVACEVFIVLNGGRLQASDIDLYPRYIGLADGSISETEFADWLRPRIAVAPAGKVQEPTASYRR
ncbi:type II toxin-antitoxin system death-on-curing family toxin [Pseudoxanthomonas sp. PXM02]|uniref:type II toxin-antitoxin system death-on-curing family toxin n=1 Tax=Pseudoxanthomonas sp. PXM02 TaxID=2769294 RepID=UPI001785EA0B|nr:type II toxin-antitoxin system death-on-curing family toxin [Pseudoxanthomonas sp. PXM02]MBD9478092.1 type II toxin-antitoxin system death-on-curing family toxin [Pseudoxanthomonas sp. PXM02]